jgi:hypothetical protein
VHDLVLGEHLSNSTTRALSPNPYFGIGILPSKYFKSSSRQRMPPPKVNAV